LDEDARPQIYFPYKQRTQDRMAIAVRTRTDPSKMGASLAAAIRAVDPEQPIYDAYTLQAVVDRSVAQEWLQTVLLGSFAGIALVLASIGVYGVIAYAVGQRRREFGIRLALGARRAEIIRLVMRRGALLCACGAAIGLVAAAASARVFSSLLFNVSGLDLVSFAVSTLILLAVALAACGFPARRAASVDPALALRAE
jgi:putative ABC transport system permease protein